MVKLLIVDDNEQNRYMLEVLLKGHGYSVESATNGAEALEAARRDPPDMIISDILMPVMDGFALCRRWKRDEQLKQIPFVFYTATYTDPKDEAFALDLGAERFIIKPMEPDEFIRILQEVVEAHQGGRLVAPREPVAEEEAYIREYNETLVRKLEDKVQELKREVARRLQAERELVLDQVRFEALYELSQMIDEPEDAIADFALEAGVRVTDSKVGHICFVSEDETHLTVHARSRDVTKACTMPEKQTVYRVEGTGPWREAIRQRKPIITNDCQAPNPLKEGYPGGHVPIIRYMSIPLIDNGKIVLVAGVGNKEDEYDESDVRQLTLIMDGMWRITQKKKTEEALAREAVVHAAMAELSQALIAPTSIEDVSALVLDQAKQLTDSEFGFVGYIDPQTGYLISPTLTRDVWDVCQVPDKDIVFKEFSGLWGWVLGNRKPLLTNSPSDDPRASGTPPGHVPIRQVLSAPALSGDILLGLLTLANPGRDYTERDLALAERLAAVYALAVQRQRAEKERERLLAQIQEQARQVQQIVDTVPEGVVLLDAEDRMILANPAALKNLETLTGAQVGDVLVSLGERLLSEFVTWPEDASWHEIKVDGHIFEIITRPVPIASESTGQVLVVRDMTRERVMQQRIRQQDRLAAIGQLAGGVAHDFNNVLTAIEGYSELALSSLASDDPRDWPSGREMRADLGEVVKAAERAAGLTRQLLAFSRRQVLQPRVLDLNTVIAGFERMLRRLLGEDIELVTFLAPELGRVEADQGQIEQVIMNLAVNARDAMPGGGQLTLETANVTLDEVYARAHVEVQPGPYVMLAVSDTGIGMTEEVQTRIFEPFFTTKEKDKGTGLGLSVVHGIVKQSGGHINVYSEPGAGTTFKVYLPQQERETEVAEQAQASRVPLHGTETILVAEDEEAVRILACRVLREHGYTVLEAGHPEDALRLASEHTDPIHLLLTDVVMPGMSGRALAERLSPSHPGVAVLYISGYTDSAIVHHGVLDVGTPFLQKPFNTLTLARKVREVLGASLPGELVEQPPVDLDAQSLRAGNEVPETPASETAGAISLTRESLARLPADLVAEVREATINADIDRLYELIDRIETRDAPVAAELRALASRCQNDTLLDLFDAGEEEP